MTKIAEWRKAIAAAVLGVPAWGVVAQVDGIEPVEWWGLAGVLATALVVWIVPNDPVTIDITARLEELGLRDDIPTTGSPEAGQSILVMALVAAAVCLVLLLVLDLVSIG